MGTSLLVVIFFIFSSLMLPFSDAQESQNKMTLSVKPFVIFGPNRTVTIAHSACNNDKARHGVKVGKDNQNINMIHWRWDNKRTSWCGWGIQDIPNKDFTSYEKDFKLIIKLKGSWTDKAPQIKFMDIKNKSTKVIRITKFMQGDPKSKDGAYVAIPLAKFDMDWSIDIKKVHTLQFDAAYESSTGDIKIYLIKIGKQF